MTIAILQLSSTIVIPQCCCTRPFYLYSYFTLTLTHTLITHHPHSHSPPHPPQLVASSQASPDLAACRQETSRLQSELSALLAVHEAAQELLGLKEEEVEAARADVEDLRALCREQAARLAGMGGRG